MDSINIEYFFLPQWNKIGNQQQKNPNQNPNRLFLEADKLIHTKVEAKII